MTMKISSTAFLLLGTMLLGLARSGAAATVNLIKNADFGGGREGWMMSSNEYGEVVLLDATDPRSGFSKVARATIKQVVENKPYIVRLSQKLDFVLRESETLTFKAWLRSSQSVKIGVVLEKVADSSRPFSDVLELSPSWKEYQVKGTVNQRYEAGEMAIVLHLAYETGTVDIAGVRLLAERNKVPDGTAVYNASAYNTAPIGPSAGTPPPVSPPVSPPTAPVATPKPTPVATPKPATSPATPVTPPAAGAEPENLIATPDFARTDNAWRLPDSAEVKSSIIAAEDVPFEKAVRFVVNVPAGTAADQGWALYKLGPSLPKGTPLTLKVWMRSPEKNKVIVGLQKAIRPYSSSFTGTLNLTPNWKEYLVKGTAQADHAPQESQIFFWLTAGPGTIEMTGVRFYAEGVRSLGLSTPPAGPVGSQNLIAMPDFPPQGRETWQIPRIARLQESYFDATVGGVSRKAGRFVAKPEPGEMPHRIWMACIADAPIKRDEVLTARAWLRSPDSNPVTMRIQEAREQADGERKAFCSEKLTLTPDWKEYEVRGTARRDYDPKEVGVYFHLGHAPGTIEMTGVRLLSANRSAPITAPATAPTPVARRPPSAPPATVGMEGPSLLQNGDFAQGAAHWEGAADSLRGKVSFVDAQAGPFKRALHVVSTPGTSDKPWTVSLRQNILSPLKKGDKLKLSVWLRSPDSGKIAVVAEQIKAPSAKLLTGQLRLTSQWAQYELSGEAASDFAAGEVRLHFYLSLEPMTVEIAGVRLSKAP